MLWASLFFVPLLHTTPAGLLVTAAGCSLISVTWVLWKVDPRSGLWLTPGYSVNSKSSPGWSQLPPLWVFCNWLDGLALVSWGMKSPEQRLDFTFHVYSVCIKVINIISAGASYWERAEIQIIKSVMWSEAWPHSLKEMGQLGSQPPWENIRTIYLIHSRRQHLAFSVSPTHPASQPCLAVP